VGMFGNGSCLVIADMRVEGSHQHQALL
jgi:hypothetical protein